MNYRMIKSPTAGTRDILLQRSSASGRNELSCSDAVGLVQGRLIDMVYAADIAEKAAGVQVLDIRGSCPQNMIMLAIFGDTASVEAAVNEIKEKIEQTKAGDKK